MYVHPLYGLVDDGEDIEAEIEKQFTKEDAEADRRERELPTKNDDNPPFA